MTGLKSPESINLEMCPKVMKSCCQYQDQILMYSNWSQSGESDNLKAKMVNIQGVYTQLFDQLILVRKLAKNTFKLLKEKEVSNCKELSR